MSQSSAGDSSPTNASQPFDLFIAVTAIIVLSLLSWRMFLEPSSETVHLIDLFDLGICGIFFIDFIRNLVIAPSKIKYLLTWGHLTGDGRVSIADILLLISAWG